MKGRYAGMDTEQMKLTRDEALMLVQQDGNALALLDDAFRADREIALAAVANCGWALQYIPEPLRSDWEVVRTAMNNDPDVLELAGKDFLACRDRFMNQNIHRK